MHHSHRTWFPFILIGLTIILLLVIIVAYSHPATQEAQEVQILSQQEYEQRVQDILTNYQANQDAQRAYEVLLDLRIGDEQKDVHLDLVLMFGKLLAGELESIDQTLDQLDDTSPWLTK